MSAGLEVRAPNRNLVIDATYQNIVFDRKFCIADAIDMGLSPSNNITNPWKFLETKNWGDLSRQRVELYKLPLTQDDLFYALGGPGINKLFTSLIIFRASGPADDGWNNLRIYAVPGKDIKKDFDDVFCYVFRKSKPVHSSYGLQVFNEKGEPVFDSSQKYMRVVGYGDIGAFAGPEEATAVVSPIAGSSKQDFYFFFSRYSGGYIRLYSDFEEGFTASALFNVSPPTMIIDVTDY